MVAAVHACVRGRKMVELKDVKTEKLMEELADRGSRSLLDAYLLIAFCKKVVEVWDEYEKHVKDKDTPPEIILN
jgi:hypothetical protein